MLIVISAHYNSCQRMHTGPVALFTSVMVGTQKTILSDQQSYNLYRQELESVILWRRTTLFSRGGCIGFVACTCQVGR
jgi:hypothetical protein